MSNTEASSAINENYVAVIIVNYKTATLALKALKSLANERQFLPNLKTVVVDNQSPDDSFSQLQNFIAENDYSSWVKAELAEKNGGFAYGNNVGIATYQASFQKADKREPNFYWLLNPDAFLRPQAGVKLVEFLGQYPNAIGGSRLEDADGTLQLSTFNFPSAMSEILAGFGLGILDRIFSRHRVLRNNVDKPEKIDWVAGASLMIPIDIFNRVGPMDDDYFLYFEEVDYCLQIQRAGYDCWYIPESRVVHEVGAATGISDTRKKQPRRPQYWFESRQRYFRKNFGVWATLIADAGWATGYALWCARKYFTDREDFDRQPPMMLRDFLRYSSLKFWG
ncbi:MAG: N-acetylglucosaminyl-diphospho-decaprenol L-rhamnosyltransferase [Lentisphaeria bacterium]|jgi:N-acetylglucosaminyl-diphospho-decaprenol L-rhamnosyltransferase